MPNKIIAIIIGALIIAGGSFYIGSEYGGENQSAAARAGVMGLNGGNRFSQNGTTGGMPGARNARGGNGGFVSGEVISKDSMGITVKLPSGGSKIIFLSNKTSVTKTVSDTTGNITVGKQVTITGTANSDGSMTANAVQIRPELPVGQ